MDSSSEAYRIFFDQHPLPMYVLDEESLAILAVNEAAVRHYGYSHAEFLSLKATDLRPTEDIPKFLDTIHGMTKDRRQFHETGIWRHLKKDGTLIHVQVNARRVDFKGHVGYLVAIHDVTEQVRIDREREQVQRSSRFMQYAIDHVGVAQYWMGPDARFIYVNDASTESLGYSREELLKMTVHDIDPDFQREVWPAHWDDVRKKKSFTIRTRHKTKEGRIFPVEVTVNYVVFDGKEFNVAFARDISDLVKMERIVVQSEKMSAVGQLAAGIAHEINNPLGVVLGFAEVLLEQTPPENPIRHPLESIEREAHRCRSLVQDLLTFSRERKPGTAPESLDEILEGALSLVVTRARLQNVEVRREYEPDLPKVAVDRNQIQQVIINLCTNACDAMPKGGTLTVHVAKAQDHVEIRVKDTGCGMSPEVQQRMFEPFFTTKELGKGTGLGLSLAYETVKKHNGQIDVKSEVGKGSVFIVRLPLTPSKGSLAA